MRTDIKMCKATSHPLRIARPSPEAKKETYFERRQLPSSSSSSLSSSAAFIAVICKGCSPPVESGHFSTSHRSDLALWLVRPTHTLAPSAITFHDYFIFAFSHLSFFLFSTLATKKGMFKFYHPHKSFPNDCKNIFLFSSFDQGYQKEQEVINK